MIFWANAIGQRIQNRTAVLYDFNPPLRFLTTTIWIFFRKIKEQWPEDQFFRSEGKKLVENTESCFEQRKWKVREIRTGQGTRQKKKRSTAQFNRKFWDFSSNFWKPNYWETIVGILKKTWRVKCRSRRIDIVDSSIYMWYSNNAGGEGHFNFLAENSFFRKFGKLLLALREVKQNKLGANSFSIYCPFVPLSKLSKLILRLCKHNAFSISCN